jgi:hypothetical protein
VLHSRTGIELCAERSPSLSCASCWQSWLRSPPWSCPATTPCSSVPGPPRPRPCSPRSPTRKSNTTATTELFSPAQPRARFPPPPNPHRRSPSVGARWASA